MVKLQRERSTATTANGSTKLVQSMNGIAEYKEKNNDISFSLGGNFYSHDEIVNPKMSCYCMFCAFSPFPRCVLFAFSVLLFSESLCRSTSVEQFSILIFRCFFAHILPDTHNYWRCAHCTLPIRNNNNFPQR